jgi:NADH:ubiquinone oxidoreductase subunit H
MVHKYELVGGFVTEHAGVPFVVFISGEYALWNDQCAGCGPLALRLPQI